MGACSGITMGSSYDCENPLKASVAERLLIGTQADIESIVYNTTNTSVVENIIMKAGTMMYAFDGVRSSNIPQVDLVADDISVGFNHQVDFSAFEVDSAAKVNLQGMAAKKTFAIYQNPKDSSLGDAVWEVLGLSAGLEMSTLQRLPASKDGSYKIQLKTSEQSSETGLPNSFWDTDIETTEAIIDSLYSGGALLLQSAVVEIAAPTDVVVRLSDPISNYGQIELGGTVVHVIDTISVAANDMTITTTTPYVAGDEITISGNFESTTGVLQLTNEDVTNNIV